MSGPVSRLSWLGGRALTALVILVISGLAGGLGGWVGAASQHSGVSVTTMLDAGLNLVPPAIAIYGVGLLAFGVWPRRASVVAHALLGWSLLVVIIGGSINERTVNRWVLDTSVFHHMAASPAVSPHWAANAVMAGIGILAAAVGAAAFHRRDFQGE